MRHILTAVLLVVMLAGCQGKNTPEASYNDVIDAYGIRMEREFEDRFEELWYYAKVDLAEKLKGVADRYEDRLSEYDTLIDELKATEIDPAINDTLDISTLNRGDKILLEYTVTDDTWCDYVDRPAVYVCGVIGDKTMVYNQADLNEMNARLVK